MTFIKKAKKIPVQGPFRNRENIKVSIAGIKKLILKNQTAAKRSHNPTYVLARQQKIEKLTLILADLNLLVNRY